MSSESWLLPLKWSCHQWTGSHEMWISTFWFVKRFGEKLPPYSCAKFLQETRAFIQLFGSNSSSCHFPNSDGGIGNNRDKENPGYMFRSFQFALYCTALAHHDSCEDTQTWTSSCARASKVTHFVCLILGVTVARTMRMRETYVTSYQFRKVNNTWNVHRNSLNVLLNCQILRRMIVYLLHQPQINNEVRVSRRGYSNKDINCTFLKTIRNI